MKATAYITGILLVLMILSSCEGVFNKTVRGSGDILSMEVEVPSFDGVSVTGTCNVNIQIGESFADNYTEWNRTEEVAKGDTGDILNN